VSDETTPEKAPGLELLSEFAHEIRTPLTAMLGYTSFLKGDGDVQLTPEQSKDIAERLHTSTKRLMQITERILDEAITGAPKVKKEKIDFSNFSDELVGTFEVDAKARGINLVHDIADNFPELTTDPVLLYEMLSNLISNALKFTPKGGEVKIKGEVDIHSKGLILVIQDTGKGIPATILMRMLQGTSTTTSSAQSDQKGWGKGVQLVREKAELLGGELEIENAPQGGTVACIRIPPP